MSYSSNLTDEQWTLLEPVFNAPGKRGPKHATDLRRVVDAMLYISHTAARDADGRADATPSMVVLPH